MTNIKVTVTYEQPTTTKFDALMAEYAAAKKVADETVAYYKPLADAAEEAKFDAIMEQLETIKGYVKQLSAFSPDVGGAVHAYISASMRGNHCTGGLYFKVEYLLGIGYRIMWGDFLFTRDRFQNTRYAFTSGGHNIIGNWDEWKVYEALENDALRQIRSKIEAQHKRAQAQIDRLSNVVEI